MRLRLADQIVGLQNDNAQMFRCAPACLGSPAEDRKSTTDSPPPSGLIGHICASQPREEFDRNVIHKLFSIDNILVEQQKDAAISAFRRLMETHTERPEWTAIQNECEETKVLWAQWQSMVLRDGLLCRQFTTPGHLADRLQSRSTNQSAPELCSVRPRVMRPLEGRQDGQRSRPEGLLCWMETICGAGGKSLRHLLQPSIRVRLPDKPRCIRSSRPGPWICCIWI